MDQLEFVLDENTELVDNLFVPDVNSNDAEERKLARRIRIQKRIEAVARQHKGADQIKAERAAERITLLQKQLEKSSEVLHELFKEAEHQVTNVRVVNDKREVDRREGDAVRRGNIYAQLQEDAKLSMGMFEEIATKWESILSYNDPLNIYDDLQVQKEKCDELIKQKDGVIAMVKRELRQAESRFFLDQQCQNADIRLLAKRVERQVTIMRAAHAVELQHIEDVMIQERSNMMENNDRRWNEMYRRRKEQELAISDYKVKQQKDFEETVTRVRIRHYEKIREVKIALERDCGQLQKEFEFVKMSAIINSEKMDYNYQILKKREDENIIIRGNQKRLLNKLQDSINDLRKKIRVYEKQTKVKISKLCSEILYIQKCIATEKKKSKAVSVSNDKRYMEIWELNRKVANKILKKILDMDKILCEQQLGINWREPHIRLHVKEKLPSFKAAVKQLEARYGSNASHIPKMKKKRKFANPQVAINTSSVGYRRLMQLLLEKLAERGGFLIENNIDTYTLGASKCESVLVKVDNVIDALGIKVAQDINIMLHFFKPYIYCPICRPDILPFEVEDDVDMISAGTSQTVGMGDGTGYTHGYGSGSSAKSGIALIGSLALEPTFEGHDINDAVDTIVASVVNPKRLRGSSSQLNLVQKVGECIGPAQLLADAERRMAQMGDHVTVMGNRTSESCLVHHPLYMNPSMVMRALREFVTKVQCRRNTKDSPASNELASATQTVSRLLKQSEVEEYWNRYKVLLSARTSDLWDALKYGLQKYHSILEERHRLNEELEKLQKQNTELKFLLKQYKNSMKSKPPCAVERRSFEVLKEADFHPSVPSDEVLDEEDDL